jgi:hypothetical protein
MDKEIVNTAARKDFILDKLVPAVETFEKKPESTCVFPNAYIRTLNAKPSQTKLASLLARHFSHLLAFLFFLEVLELL